MTELILKVALLMTTLVIYELPESDLKADTGKYTI